MTLVNQPSVLPTNKLTAATALFALFDLYLEPIVNEWLLMLPLLADKPATAAFIAGAAKILGPLVIAYSLVKDRANVEAPAV